MANDEQVIIDAAPPAGAPDAAPAEEAARILAEAGYVPAPPEAAPAGAPAEPATPSAETAPTVTSAAQWAEISRREGQIARRLRDLDTRESKLAERETGIADLQALAREDPLAAMAKLNLDLEGVAQYALRDEAGVQQTPYEDREARSRAESVAAEVAMLKQQIETDAQQRRLNTRITEIQQAIDTSPALELSRIHGTDALRLVMEAQDLYLEDNGQMPDLGSLLAQLELHYEGVAGRIIEAGKIKSKMQPAPVAPQTEPVRSPVTRDEITAVPAAQLPPRTLSNDMTRDAPARLDRPKSDEEYRADALALMKNS